MFQDRCSPLGGAPHSSLWLCESWRFLRWGMTCHGCGEQRTAALWSRTEPKPSLKVSLQKNAEAAQLLVVTINGLQHFQNRSQQTHWPGAYWTGPPGPLGHEQLWGQSIRQSHNTRSFPTKQVINVADFLFQNRRFYLTLLDFTWFYFTFQIHRKNKDWTTEKDDLYAFVRVNLPKDEQISLHRSVCFECDL